MGKSLKEKLQQGETVFGCFSLIPSPQIQEIIGVSGFDFAIIDFEHGTMDLGTAENLMRAQMARGLTTAVRVKPGDLRSIGKVLDMGAEVVQIPQIGSKEEAENAVRAAKFPPRGERGAAHVVRAASYCGVDRSDYYANANEDTMVILQIEGLEAAKQAESIMSVDGVDVIFLGPHDLAQALGVPGQTEHPLVEGKMEELVTLAKKHHKWVGTYVESVRAAEKWSKLGVQYLAFQSDVDLIHTMMKQTADSLQGLKK